MPTRHLRAINSLSNSETAGRQEEAGASQVACPVTLQHYANGKVSLKENSIAVESDIRVQVNGYQEAVLSRTPGDDLNLIAGYLFSRSMIRETADMMHVGFSYHGVARVEVKLKSSTDIRRIFPSPCPVHVDPEQLFVFKKTFERRQNLYKNTGSTHAAALFSKEGDLIAFGEDVGRHNAFDKAIGRALLEGTLDLVTIAMLSSRLALELAVKASMANIPILCGFSAATSSGINYSEKNNLTLIGRLRERSFNIYSNGWRVRSEKSAD